MTKAAKKAAALQPVREARMARRARLGAAARKRLANETFNAVNAHPLTNA